MIQTNPRIRGLTIMAGIFIVKNNNSIEVKFTADAVATGKFYHYVRLSNEKLAAANPACLESNFT